MRKILYIIGVLIISFLLEYLMAALVFAEMDFTFGAGVSAGEVGFCLLPIAVMIIVTVVSSVCGKRIFKDWKHKDRILMIVAPIISTIIAFFLFVVLHP